MKLGLMASVTGRQGMLTPPRHLIPPLVYPEVDLCLPYSQNLIYYRTYEIDDCSLFMLFMLLINISMNKKNSLPEMDSVTDVH
jgi:hypothetical protein